MLAGAGEVGHVSARLRIRLPETTWIETVSTSFPDAVFRLLAGVPTDRGAMHLGEVRADRPEAVTAAIRDRPDVLEYEQLHVTADRALARYEADETGHYEFVEHVGVVPDYPTVVRNGWFSVDLRDTRERVTAIRDTLEAAGMPFELVSIVDSLDDDRLLTDRQCEAIDVALRAGYFEVPRESSLADVADTLGVDSSTASGLIRRGVATLVERDRGGSSGRD
jgi:predicted DNA binding protein